MSDSYRILYQTFGAMVMGKRGIIGHLAKSGKFGPQVCVPHYLIDNAVAHNLGDSFTRKSCPSLTDIMPSTGRPSSASGKGGSPTNSMSKRCSSVATKVVTEYRAKKRPLQVVFPPPNGRQDELRDRLFFCHLSGWKAWISSPKMSSSKCSSLCGTRTRFPCLINFPPMTVSRLTSRTEADQLERRSVSCHIASIWGHLTASCRYEGSIKSGPTNAGADSLRYMAISSGLCIR